MYSVRIRIIDMVLVRFVNYRNLAYNPRKLSGALPNLAILGLRAPVLWPIRELSPADGR